MTEKHQNEGFSLWSGDSALKEQQERSIEFDIQDLNQKSEFLQVEKYFKNRFGSFQPDCIVDIGGGFRGGALSLFRGAKHSILVDKIGQELTKLGQMPEHVEVNTADFAKLPLPDGCAEVVFAWEVFDHAYNKDHFRQGFIEAVRILKLGGLLFLVLPLRYQPRDGHPVCINIGEVRKNLERFVILREMAMGLPFYKDLTLFAVAQKLTNHLDGFFIWSESTQVREDSDGNLFYMGQVFSVRSARWTKYCWLAGRYRSARLANRVRDYFRAEKKIDCCVSPVERIGEFVERKHKLPKLSDDEQIVLEEKC